VSRTLLSILTVQLTNSRRTQRGPSGNVLYLGTTLTGYNLETTDAAGKPGCITSTATSLASAITYTGAVVAITAYEQVARVRRAAQTPCPAVSIAGDALPKPFDKAPIAAPSSSTVGSHTLDVLTGNGALTTKSYLTRALTTSEPPAEQVTEPSRTTERTTVLITEPASPATEAPSPTTEKSTPPSPTSSNTAVAPIAPTSEPVTTSAAGGSQTSLVPSSVSGVPAGCTSIADGQVQCPSPSASAVPATGAGSEARPLLFAHVVLGGLVALMV